MDDDGNVYGTMRIQAFAGSNSEQLSMIPSYYKIGSIHGHVFIPTDETNQELTILNESKVDNENTQQVITRKQKANQNDRSTYAPISSPDNNSQSINMVKHTVKPLLYENLNKEQLGNDHNTVQRKKKMIQQQQEIWDQCKAEQLRVLKIEARQQTLLDYCNQRLKQQHSISPPRREEDGKLMDTNYHPWDSAITLRSVQPTSPSPDNNNPQLPNNASFRPLSSSSSSGM